MTFGIESLEDLSLETFSVGAAIFSILSTSLAASIFCLTCWGLDAFFVCGLTGSEIDSLCVLQNISHKLSPSGVLTIRFVKPFGS